MNTSLDARTATTVATESVAEAYLALLRDRGIDYLYVGCGTDTAPVVEAYSNLEASGLNFPTPIVAVHENLAIGMAHGHYMISLRPQAVMLHVSVGTANAVCGVFNAARAQVPMLFTAGRTPLFEDGPLGSRSNDVHWSQEMFDQAGMVRELVKWDYELRGGRNVEQVIDRALSISMAEPRGPVYLTLPREVLAHPHPSYQTGGAYPRVAPAHPDPLAVRTLAQRLLDADSPVIVTSNAGADPESVELLATLATRFGIGVLENKPRYVCFPTDHPMHVGFELSRVFAKADAMLFLETDVPWIPALTKPRDDAFLAHAGTDPMYVRYPIRSFRSDLTITANASVLIRALTAELAAMGGEAAASQRRQRLDPLTQGWRTAAARQAAEDDNDDAPITKLFFSRAIAAIRPAGGIVVNESPALRPHMSFNEAGTYFQLPPSGGLGWGMPAALGAKQAAPGRVVIATLGDGAYIFANPAACHQASEMHDLPMLTVIYNNEAWAAVQRSTTDIYPDSHAKRHIKAHGHAPLSSLKPLPAFEKYAEASNGYGERVTERSQLIPALQRALDVVVNEGRQALVNVIGA